MIKRLSRRFKRNEKGQGMVEYGLILALISIVALSALGSIGGSVKGQFDKVGNYIESPEMAGLINDGYIPIATADELNNLRSSEVQMFGQGTVWEGEYRSGLDKKYIQVSDINLRNMGEFDPLGDHEIKFTGTFDGGGYAISNLRVNKWNTFDNERYYFSGLFGDAEGATLNNINLDRVDVKGYLHVGGLVGRQTNTKVSNVKVSGNVSSYAARLGGLVGTQHNSTIDNSYTEVNVTGFSSAGGLVGHQEDSEVVNCYATRGVTVKNQERYTTGHNSAGGLVGVQRRSKIIDSFANGQVYGVKGNEGTMGYDTGGLVGSQSDESSIVNSYATGRVTAGGRNAGGLVGNNESGSIVDRSYASGNAKGSQNVGGLVGSASDNSLVSNSYATGSAESNYFNSPSRSGGLVGYLYNSKITNSYATGSSVASSDAGGLVGSISYGSSVSNSYASGNVHTTGMSTGRSGRSGGFSGIIVGSSINDSGWVTKSGVRMAEYTNDITVENVKGISWSEFNQITGELFN